MGSSGTDGAGDSSGSTETSVSDDALDSHGSDIGKRTNSWTRAREWVLVEADRLVVAAAIAFATFFGFLGLGAIGVIGFINDDTITRLAGGMIAGTFSLVTLVVSINQLILSREFAAAGESEEQLRDVLTFRDDVSEASSADATPASPSVLLELLVHATRDRADALADAVDDHDEEVREVVVPFVNNVRESTDRIDETLEHATFGSFETVSAMVGYDDGWQLYVARNLRKRYGDRLSEEADDALDDLIESVELFSVARGQFKTTYLQRELTRFSQLTIYTGVPAILAAMLIGFLYADFGGAAIDTDFLPYVVSALLAVVVSPLSLLASYILRTATVTRRTSSIGPMLPQKDPGEGPFDVPDE